MTKFNRQKVSNNINKESNLEKIKQEVITIEQQINKNLLLVQLIKSKI
jgi:superfamily II DNA/RNA helicase